MKREALLKQLRQIAKANGVPMEFGEGGKHGFALINGQRITIPRHSEIAEGTAKAIIKQATEAVQ